MYSTYTWVVENGQNKKTDDDFVFVPFSSNDENTTIPPPKPLEPNWEPSPININAIFYPSYLITNHNNSSHSTRRLRAM